MRQLPVTRDLTEPDPKTITWRALRNYWRNLSLTPARTPGPPTPESARNGGPGHPRCRRTVLGNRWFSKSGSMTGWVPSERPIQSTDFQQQDVAKKPTTVIAVEQKTVRSPLRDTPAKGKWPDREIFRKEAGPHKHQESVKFPFAAATRVKAPCRAAAEVAPRRDMTNCWPGCRWLFVITCGRAPCGPP